MAVLPAIPLRLTDANGNPYAGAKLYVFEAGTTTETDSYTTSALSVANTNPVVADSGGLFGAVYLAPGSYKLRYTTSADVLVFERDNYVVTSESSALSFGVETKTANFTVTSADQGKMFVCDASGIGGLVMTITADSETLGVNFPVFFYNSGATGTITVQGVSAQEIDGAATKSLTTQYSSLGLVSLGATGWGTVMSSNLGVGSAAALDVATATHFRANTADKVLVTDDVWSAASVVTLTDAATIAVDMSTFINAQVTLGGNRTLGQPSNTKIGQSGFIRVIQDGTGSRTLAYHADWKFSGGTDPTASTAAGTTDLLFYTVIATNFIAASMTKGLA